jgi:hypothetical protein
MLRVLILIFLLPTTLAAQEAEPPMTLERMARIVEAIDADANISGSAFELTIDDIPVLVVTDVTADRMRAMVPIRAADALDEAELRRLMQANFDTALDARYAVANGRLWSVFIHPFSSLETRQFISGLAQTVTAAQTYGTLYSSGGAQFGGGDSVPLQRQLLERLTERGQDI